MHVSNKLPVLLVEGCLQNRQAGTPPRGSKGTLTYLTSLCSGYTTHHLPLITITTTTSSSPASCDKPISSSSDSLVSSAVHPPPSTVVACLSSLVFGRDLCSILERLVPDDYCPLFLCLTCHLRASQTSPRQPYRSIQKRKENPWPLVTSTSTSKRPHRR